VQNDIVELTKGGALPVVEAVGNQESLDLAVEVARRGGTVSFVGVPHNVRRPHRSIANLRPHVTARPGR
jgi:threonine dehydrogenase-like Zn-dependent dehydrogenase